MVTARCIFIDDEDKGARSLGRCWAWHIARDAATDFLPRAHPSIGVVLLGSGHRRARLVPLDGHEQEVRVLQVRQELHRVSLLVRLQHHLLS